MTKKYTFRTEGFDFQNELAPKLAEECGLTINHTEVERENELLIHIHHCTSNLPFDVIKSKMKRLAWGDDRYIDMHRCSQTLAEGDEPNEDWWKPHGWVESTQEEMEANQRKLLEATRERIKRRKGLKNDIDL